jgi:hypothetical protein
MRGLIEASRASQCHVSLVQARARFLPMVQGVLLVEVSPLKRSDQRPGGDVTGS